MKINSTKDKDRNEKLIGMTADYTSQTEKVLFFADPYFLFCQRTLHTLASHTSQPSNQSLPKSAILPTLTFTI